MQPSRRGVLGWFLGPYAGYLRRLRPLLAICVFLFVSSAAMGYILGNSTPAATRDSIIGTMPDLSGLSTIEMFAYIVANNASLSLLFMVLGLLGAIPPLLFVVLNGFYVGLVSWETVSLLGPVPVVVGLTPHGVIEIPAVLMSMAMGMGLGYSLLAKIRGRSGFGQEVRYALGFFIGRVVPMLILAAIIEVAVTYPALLRLGYA